jgi:hypothetical protein
MDAATRRAVWERAGRRCEYCRLHQGHLPFTTFHVEHVIARKHGGTGDFANLALACDRCNVYKGSDLTGVDPQTGKIVRLFNPRTQVWEQHFRFDGPAIVGRTLVGRVTAQVLNMNAPPRLRLRARLLANDET